MDVKFIMCLLAVNITMSLQAVRIINETGVPYTLHKFGAYTGCVDIGAIPSYYDIEEKTLGIHEAVEVNGIEFFVCRAIQENSEDRCIEVDWTRTESVTLIFDEHTFYDEEKSAYTKKFVSWINTSKSGKSTYLSYR